VIHDARKGIPWKQNSTHAPPRGKVKRASDAVLSSSVFTNP